MKYFKLYEDFRDYGEAADRITDIYLNNLDSLPKMKQQHLLSRLEVVYQKKFPKLEMLGKWLAGLTEERFKLYLVDPSSAYDAFIESRVANNANAKAKQIGNSWVESIKAEASPFLAYLEILMCFNIIKRIRCEKFLTIESEMRDWLVDNFDKMIDFVIKNPKAFINIPVQSVNVFYYMKSLDLINRDIMAEKEGYFLFNLKSTYDGITKMDDIQFHNYLYALTHVIIGESWFYEKSLPTYKERYGWIIDFFDKNTSRILESTEDIIAEIGVVYLICCENAAAEKYKSVMYDKISKYGWVLPLSGSLNYSDGEHTNVLTIMLLHGI